MQADRSKLLHLGNLVVPILCGLLSVAILGPNPDIAQTLSSSTYTRLVTPAPFTFAIWGPIFLFIGISMLYYSQDLLWPTKRFLREATVPDASLGFMISTLCTTAWYLTWVAGWIWPAIACMYLYLAAILTTYLRLGINLTPLTPRPRLLITCGWSLYAGWVTSATIVNTTTGLVSTNLPIFLLNQIPWSILILVMALAIYVTVLVRRRDGIFAGVGIWVLTGVLADQILYRSVPILEIVYLTVAGLLIISSLALYMRLRPASSI